MADCHFGNDFQFYFQSHFNCTNTSILINLKIRFTNKCHSFYFLLTHLHGWNCAESTGLFMNVDIINIYVVMYNYFRNSSR
jgi:hypothetical protein